MSITQQMFNNKLAHYLYLGTKSLAPIIDICKIDEFQLTNVGSCKLGASAINTKRPAG